MFQRILIANRGEIAVRIIRACREMGIRTVAVHSEADANAMHVRLADEAALIGPPAPRDSYLRIDRIVEAAQSAQADAIHPGFGFLSENAEFAEAVASAGLVFIGPTADSIRRMGSKTEARAIMQRAGVPVAPGFQPMSHETLSSEQWLTAAAQIGYPVLVKAAAGGGGRGMRVARTAAELPEALAAARREAANAFGDGSVFLEKYLDDARHIEFQVLADAAGSAVHLFERECSIQRRHQKIIEETPSPLLSQHPRLREQMGRAAVAAAQAVKYENAGTVEFIVDPRALDFYFLEMNTRLQVEHPITEAVTGIDLVRAQIRIAAGEPLWFAQNDLAQRGHAIECRVYAEDPAHHFLPAVGRVLRAVEPQRPGVRVDSGVTTGDEVSIHYDPMIAKVIAHAETRADAIRRMDAALADYTLLGVTTNIPFLRGVLAHPAFREGETTTRFIENYFGAWRAPDAPDEILIAAALAQLGSERLEVGSRAAAGDAWDRADGFRIGAA